MKSLAVFFAFASTLLAGPFKVAPSSMPLFGDREIYDPGLIPNLPALYTFGNPHPDFGRCGQIGFISTLEDGSPDPKAIPGFIQISSPCRPEHGFGLELNEHHEWREPGEHPTAVPEPATWAFVMFCLVAIVATVYINRFFDKIRHKLQRLRTHDKEIFAIDQVIADEPDLAGRAAVIQAIIAERAQWKAKAESARLLNEVLARGPSVSAQYTGDAAGRAIRTRDAWQPIATAPKRGTIITSSLLENGQQVGLSYWLPESRMWAHWAEGYQPTHWMPLPEPPEIKLVLAAPPVPVMRDGEALYSCPWCEVKKPASDNAFWEAHKVDHPDKWAPYTQAAHD